LIRAFDNGFGRRVYVILRNCEAKKRYLLQLYKTIEGAVARGAKRIRVHALADGRDVQDGSSVKFFGELRDEMKKVSEEKGVDACVASGGGRMKVTMDRYEVRFRKHCHAPRLHISPVTPPLPPSTSFRPYEPHAPFGQLPGALL
jgi:hypothetical protein